MKKGQIALEFIFLIGIGLVMLLIFLVIVGTLGKEKTDEKSYAELDDLGKTIQQELILASNMEYGYNRKMNIPTAVNNRDFTVTTGNISEHNSYLSIDFQGHSIYYIIPSISGTIEKGDNIIKKDEDGVKITQS